MSRPFGIPRVAVKPRIGFVSLQGPSPPADSSGSSEVLLSWGVGSGGFRRTYINKGSDRIRLWAARQFSFSSRNPRLQGSHPGARFGRSVKLGLGSAGFQIKVEYFLESTSGQFGKTYLIESVIISAFLLTNNSLFGIFNSSQSEFLSKAA